MLPLVHSFTLVLSLSHALPASAFSKHKQLQQWHTYISAAPRSSGIHTSELPPTFAPSRTCTRPFLHLTEVPSPVIHTQNSVVLLYQVMLMWNCRSASSKVAAQLLQAGISITIQPGGIPEQVLTDCECEKALFPPQLGWIRLAIQHGLPLLPVYSFGENQVFQTSHWSRNFSSRVHKMTGFPLPLVSALG